MEQPERTRHTLTICKLMSKCTWMLVPAPISLSKVHTLAWEINGSAQRNYTDAQNVDQNTSKTLPAVETLA
jgi:hypothetical protein